MTDAIDIALERDAILTSKAIENAGGNWRTLEIGVQTGRLTKLRHGLYIRPDAEFHPCFDEALACALTGGFIWGPSAGRFHGLTDDLPPAISLIVKHGKLRKVEDAPVVMDVRQTRHQATLEVGIDTVKVDGLVLRITDRTRTVVDLVRMGDVRQHAVEAVRSYLAEDGAAADLHDMAEHFGVLDRVVPLTEAMMVAFDRGPGQ